MENNQTAEERICSDYVDDMSLEELKQYVFEDILHVCGDRDMLLYNFYSLDDEKQEKIRKDFPKFSTFER